MNIEIKDEVLAGEPRYRIRDNNGNILQDNVSIEQITGVIQEPTPINKALLENLQTNILNDSKQLIAEIVLDEETKSIEITNLDMMADGGIYELIVVGKLNTSSSGVLGLQINGITDEAYIYSSFGSASSSSITANFLKLGMDRNEGMIKATLGIIEGAVYCMSIDLHYSGGPTGNIYTSTTDYTQDVENITSITILTGTVAKLIAGSQIRLYKRR